MCIHKGIIYNMQPYSMCISYLLECLEVFLRQMKNYEEFEDTKVQSESVYRRRTENTMGKRKSTRGQTTIYKTNIKLKSNNTNPTKNRR